MEHLQYSSRIWRNMLTQCFWFDEIQNAGKKYKTSRTTFQLNCSHDKHSNVNVIVTFLKIGSQCNTLTHRQTAKYVLHQTQAKHHLLSANHISMQKHETVKNTLLCLSIYPVLMSTK